MTGQDLAILVPAFFVISVLYSAAGFGGGSSYLALLALIPLPFTDVRFLALACNIAVVTGSVLIFHRAGHLQPRRILPLILLSVPAAFLGARTPLAEETFQTILGLTLLVSALLMLVRTGAPEDKTSPPPQIRSLPPATGGLLGGAIGFLSGIVGIGGGILLSPALHLTNWAGARQIAATSAAFILANSVAGITGQLSRHGLPDHLLPPLALLLASVLIGGQIGARLTSAKLPALVIRRISGTLILVVAVRLLA